MKKLKEMIENPSGFDSIKNYVGDIPEPQWLVVICRNRDSDILTESNWECALKELGYESESVQVFRFGHWACGWWEALCVLEGSDAQRIGDQIHDSLESYPVLDENHFSELEMEEANRIWKECFEPHERLKYIRRNRSQFEFTSFSDLLGCARGKYFAGYASDLIG